MDPIKESVQLYVESWKLFVRRLPSGTVEHSDGVVAALGNVEISFLNLCFHDSPMVDIADVRQRLGLAIEWAAHCPFQWLLGLCVDWIPEGWEAVAGEYALESVTTTIGMATDHLQPPRWSLPKMEYQRVQDEVIARDLAELNMHAYRLPPEMGEYICNLHLWKEDSYGYVGYVNGRPVTCAATFLVNDTIYVAFVATHPNKRRKGYAEAVIRHSIEQGAQGLGLHRTTLHATEAGFPLYQAMGYEASTRFIFVAKQHEGGS